MFKMMMSIGATKPNNSLRIKLSDSVGLSAGPAPWNIIVWSGRMISLPKVALLCLRPPSVTILRRYFDLNDAQQISASVAICEDSPMSLCWNGGSRLWVSSRGVQEVSDTGGGGGGGLGSPKEFLR